MKIIVDKEEYKKGKGFLHYEQSKGWLGSALALLLAAILQTGFV